MEQRKTLLTGKNYPTIQKVSFQTPTVTITIIKKTSDNIMITSHLKMGVGPTPKTSVNVEYISDTEQRLT